MERAVRAVYRRAHLVEPEVVWFDNPQALYEAALTYSHDTLPAPSHRWNWHRQLFPWRGNRQIYDWQTRSTIPNPKWNGREPDEDVEAQERAQDRLDQRARDLAIDAMVARATTTTEERLVAAGMTVDGNTRNSVRRTYRRRFEDYMLAEISPEQRGAKILHDSTVVMLPGKAFACLPPITLVTDERHRLHNEEGPVAVYPDGWKLYAIENLVVPEDWVERPETLTPQAIRGQRNQELRRIMIQQYGLERYMEADGGQVIDEDVDELGLARRLWRSRNGRAAEPMLALEVQNSTLEPDGTRRTFFLRVPPEMRRVKQAAAWTFRLEEAQYRPGAQS